MAKRRTPKGYTVTPAPVAASDAVCPTCQELSCPRGEQCPEYQPPLAEDRILCGDCGRESCPHTPEGCPDYGTLRAALHPNATPHEGLVADAPPQTDSEDSGPSEGVIDQLTPSPPEAPTILRVEFVTKGRHPTTNKPVLELKHDESCRLIERPGGIEARGKRTFYFPWSNIAVAELPNA